MSSRQNDLIESKEKVIFLRMLQGLYSEIARNDGRAWICENCFLPFSLGCHCVVHPRAEKIPFREGIGIVEDYVRTLEIHILDLEHGL